MALGDTRERVADYACNFVLLLGDIWGTEAVLDAEDGAGSSRKLKDGEDVEDDGGCG